MTGVLERMERHATVLQRPLHPDLDEMRRLQHAQWPAHARRVIESGDPYAADGLFYRDLREPFIAADQAAVTLASTDKAIVPTSALPVLGGQYMSRIGKKVRLRAFGKITTALTPGNGTWDIYWGTNADANGVLLASSAALTLVASQTNISWEIELQIHARSLGSAGTLFCTGKGFIGTAAMAAGDFLVPASAAVVSGAVDLTAALVPSIQFKRSGSTVETITVQDFELEAFN